MVSRRLSNEVVNGKLTIMMTTTQFIVIRVRDSDHTWLE